jgi:hypothetical protein
MSNQQSPEPETRGSHSSPPPGSQFLAWMHRNFRGFFYSMYPCWNWKINGVLVTFWVRSGLVKIYHDEGRATECHPAETERCREAVMDVAND